MMNFSHAVNDGLINEKKRKEKRAFICTTGLLGKFSHPKRSPLFFSRQKALNFSLLLYYYPS